MRGFGWFSIERIGDILILSMSCGKEAYPNKKQAKRAVKHLNRVRLGQLGAKFSIYHCKDCHGWHVYTENKHKLRSNKQHARGGRR